MVASASAARLQQLRGVGPKLLEKLARLGITDIDSLLFHLPLRYEDRTRITSIGAICPEQYVVLEGRVELADVMPGRRRSLLCRISDGSGSVGLRFYYFSAAQRHSFERGRAIRVFGEVRLGATGLELYHPECQFGKPQLPPLSPALTPVYPTTDGVSQRQLRQLVQQALTQLDTQPPIDLLPLSPGGFSMTAALRLLHQPPADTDQQQLLAGTHPALERLVTEELVAHHLALLKRRQEQQRLPAPCCRHRQWVETLIAGLPFALTTAQQRVIEEILADLAIPHPMLRLLQGDVGAGKTLVAAAAALSVLESGYQVAIMAPTEILARQHWASFTPWLASVGLAPGWLAGSGRATEKQDVLQQLASGECRLVVGTHALFQKEVQFQRLGLVIIDEQHRFGVEQRLALLAKGMPGQRPHQLAMTATPIPRTLTMSLYGDLDTSVLDQLPPGRKPVTTRLLSVTREAELMQRLQVLFAQGAQAYWVCTLIEESEELAAQAAEVRFQALQEVLPAVSVALIHGRMSTAEKMDCMARFKAGSIQLLVATTVIEVGVDVPNASCMIIENAERLGLSQLHQLRGRVGRGSRQSVCLLLHQTPLSETAQARLLAMRNSNDGFFLAEEDLRIRGPGEWLGTRQAGALDFRLADLQRDERLMLPAKQLALTIRQEYPERVEPLLQRWIGQGISYARV